MSCLPKCYLLGKNKRAYYANTNAEVGFDDKYISVEITKPFVENCIPVINLPEAFVVNAFRVKILQTNKNIYHTNIFFQKATNYFFYRFAIQTLEYS